MNQHIVISMGQPSTEPTAGEPTVEKITYQHRDIYWIYEVC